jgi:hypothetical protein
MYQRFAIRPHEAEREAEISEHLGRAITQDFKQLFISTHPLGIYLLHLFTNQLMSLYFVWVVGVLGLKLRVFTLSHSTSPTFVKGFLR